ncbi:hypothetical protein [Citrobacter youngae]|uniref:hypothetical protein n=1 Tax=Citrobacter youngae TaxID=133448 RepID=UPI0039B5EFB3
MSDMTIASASSSTTGVPTHLPGKLCSRNTGDLSKNLQSVDNNTEQKSEALSRTSSIRCLPKGQPCIEASKSITVPQRLGGRAQINQMGGYTLDSGNGGASTSLKINVPARHVGDPLIKYSLARRENDETFVRTLDSKEIMTLIADSSSRDGKKLISTKGIQYDDKFIAWRNVIAWQKPETSSFSKPNNAAELMLFFREGEGVPVLDETNRLDLNKICKTTEALANRFPAFLANELPDLQRIKVSEYIDSLSQEFSNGVPERVFGIQSYAKAMDSFGKDKLYHLQKNTDAMMRYSNGKNWEGLELSHRNRDIQALTRSAARKNYSKEIKALSAGWPVNSTAGWSDNDKLRCAVIENVIKSGHANRISDADAKKYFPVILKGEQFRRHMNYVYARSDYLTVLDNMVEKNDFTDIHNMSEISFDERAENIRNAISELENLGSLTPKKIKRELKATEKALLRHLKQQGLSGETQSDALTNNHEQTEKYEQAIIELNHKLSLLKGKSYRKEIASLRLALRNITGPEPGSMEHMVATSLSNNNVQDKYSQKGIDTLRALRDEKVFRLNDIKNKHERECLRQQISWLDNNIESVVKVYYGFLSLKEKVIFLQRESSNAWGKYSDYLNRRDNPASKELTRKYCHLATTRDSQLRYLFSAIEKIGNEKKDDFTFSSEDLQNLERIQTGIESILSHNSDKKISRSLHDVIYSASKFNFWAKEFNAEHDYVSDNTARNSESSGVSIEKNESLADSDNVEKPLHYDLSDEKVGRKSNDNRTDGLSNGNASLSKAGDDIATAEDPHLDELLATKVDIDRPIKPLEKDLSIDMLTTETTTHQPNKSVEDLNTDNKSMASTGATVSGDSHSGDVTLSYDLTDVEVVREPIDDSIDWLAHGNASLSKAGDDIATAEGPHPDEPLTTETTAHQPSESVEDLNTDNKSMTSTGATASGDDNSGDNMKISESLDEEVDTKSTDELPDGNASLSKAGDDIATAEGPHPDEPLTSETTAHQSSESVEDLNTDNKSMISTGATASGGVNFHGINVNGYSFKSIKELEEKANAISNSAEKKRLLKTIKELKSALRNSGLKNYEATENGITYTVSQKQKDLNVEVKYFYNSKFECNEDATEYKPISGNGYLKIPGVNGKIDTILGQTYKRMLINTSMPEVLPDGYSQEDITAAKELIPDKQYQVIRTLTESEQKDFIAVAKRWDKSSAFNRSYYAKKLNDCFQQSETLIDFTENARSEFEQEYGKEYLQKILDILSSRKKQLQEKLNEVDSKYLENIVATNEDLIKEREEIIRSTKDEKILAAKITDFNKKIYEPYYKKNNEQMAEIKKEHDDQIEHILSEKGLKLKAGMYDEFSLSIDKAMPFIPYYMVDDTTVALNLINNNYGNLNVLAESCIASLAFLNTPLKIAIDSIFIKDSNGLIEATDVKGVINSRNGNNTTSFLFPSECLIKKFESIRNGNDTMMFVIDDKKTIFGNNKESMDTILEHLDLTPFSIKTLNSGPGVFSSRCFIIQSPETTINSEGYYLFDNERYNKAKELAESKADKKAEHKGAKGAGKIAKDVSTVKSTSSSVNEKVAQEALPQPPQAPSQPLQENAVSKAIISSKEAIRKYSSTHSLTSNNNEATIQDNEDAVADDQNTESSKYYDEPVISTDGARQSQKNSVSASVGGMPVLDDNDEQQEALYYKEMEAFYDEMMREKLIGNILEHISSDVKDEMGIYALIEFVNYVFKEEINLVGVPEDYHGKRAPDGVTLDRNKINILDYGNGTFQLIANRSSVGKKETIFEATNRALHKKHSAIKIKINKDTTAADSLKWRSSARYEVERNHGNRSTRYDMLKQRGEELPLWVSPYSYDMDTIIDMRTPEPNGGGNKTKIEEIRRLKQTLEDIKSGRYIHMSKFSESGGIPDFEDWLADVQAEAEAEVKAEVKAKAEDLALAKLYPDFDADDEAKMLARVEADRVASINARVNSEVEEMFKLWALEETDDLSHVSKTSGSDNVVAQFSNERPADNILAQGLSTKELRQYNSQRHIR